MKPKIILFPFQGQDHEMAALETALHLAKRWNAHLDVWNILPDPADMAMLYASFGQAIPYVEKSTAEIAQSNEKRRKEALSRFLKTSKKLQVSNHGKEENEGANASFHSVLGQPQTVMPQQGKIADLIVLSRSPAHDVIYEDLINTALFDTGRPVLLIPPGENGKHFHGKAIIAWNGSREAVHAIEAAKPFLENGESCVITGESDQWDTPSVSPHDLADYLNAHNIETKVLMPWISHASLADVIMGSAKKFSADLIVMGAYSHTRIRELLLGGMTAEVIKKADIPVLMMH